MGEEAYTVREKISQSLEVKVIVYIIYSPCVFEGFSQQMVVFNKCGVLLQVSANTSI